MKLIISGDREISSIDEIDKAVKQSGWFDEITEIVHGGARGVDKSAGEWAKIKGFKVTVFPAKWDDTKRQGAVIKERLNPWTKKMEKYDSAAGAFRNEQMASYADACIAIQSNGKTPGTSNMIKLAKQYNLKVFVYGQDNKADSEYKYIF